MSVQKRGDNYQAWEVKETDFPKDASPRDQFKFLARFGLLAANIHNTQPWRIKADDKGLTIFPDWKYKLAVADPHSKNLFISLGCFVKNTEVAASHFGFSALVQCDKTDPSNDLVGIHITSNASLNNLTDLFPFITQRYSNKRRYLPRSPEQEVLKELRSGLEINGTKIHLITDKNLINQTAVLQNQAIVNASKIEGFAKELARWLRMEDTTDYDGMPSFVAGIPKEQAEAFQKALNDNPATMTKLGQGDQFLIENSPVVGMISTTSSDWESMINVGRAYQELALKAFRQNLAITPMQSIVEDPETLSSLKNLLQMNNFTPQMFFRMGYADNAPYHTPRRHLEDSLVS